MPNLVLFGAGKSTPYLIKKLQEYCTKSASSLTLVDTSWQHLPNDCLQHAHTTYLQISTDDHATVTSLISKQDLVISMLPAHLHIQMAKFCLQLSKNLLTASYVSPEMQALNDQVTAKGLLFLNEMGVDPGLDHMSAMQLINDLKNRNATITSFSSHTGGLIANKNPANLWNYKFTWNPKNVITAGFEGATYLKNNTIEQIPYITIFTEAHPITLSENTYESYPNRNSLNYVEKYKLNGIKNLYRGTLRHEGFCEAWNVFVQLGMTENQKELNFNNKNTRFDFLSHFLPNNTKQNNKEVFCETIGINENHSIFKKFEQLHFFNEHKELSCNTGTAAEILQNILESEWQLEPNELDSLIMLHEIEYQLEGKHYKTISELSVIGENTQYTAMAKTVGLPMFEAALLMLSNKISLIGVHIPTHSQIYIPLLKSLKKYDLKFIEKTEILES